MSAKFVHGCLSVALLLAGCAANGERATAPAPASVEQTATPAAPRAEPAPVSPPAPAGWVRYTFPEERGDGSVLRCAAYSEREWRVAPDGDGVKVSAYRVGDVEDPLPFGIEPKKALLGLAGDRHVKRVGDGWLVGFDAGEFGGALWWFSEDGSRRRKLADENVAGFADSAAGPLALVGLAHMGTDEGKVLLVGEGREGERAVKTVADLGSAPTAFAAESPDSLIVATHARVVRATTRGEVVTLLAPKETFPYPNSLTLSKAGVLHIGMRHFVLRLSPAGEGYDAEWFVPADCRTPGMGGHACAGLRMCAADGAK